MCDRFAILGCDLVFLITNRLAKLMAEFCRVDKLLEKYLFKKTENGYAETTFYRVAVFILSIYIFILFLESRSFL